MKRAGLVVALAVAGVALTQARADRYRVSLDGLPAVYVNDVITFLAGVDAEPGVAPPAPGTLDLLTVPAPAPVAPPVLEAGADTSAASVLANAPGREPGLMIDADQLSEPPPGDPPADFAGRLASAYSITSPEDVKAIWGWYAKEPAGTADAEKLGNAVVRFVVAIDDTPAGGSTAQPKKLKPDATSGTVRDEITLRREPWGPGAGTLTPGTQLEIIPPAEGPWYRVRSPAGEGWACGLWVELR